jgi:hypothetical protein
MRIKELIEKAEELNRYPISKVEFWRNGIAVATEDGRVKLYNMYLQKQASAPCFIKPLVDGLCVKFDGELYFVCDIVTDEVLYVQVDEVYALDADCRRSYFSFRRGKKYYFFNPARELLLETENEKDFEVRKSGNYKINTQDGWTLHRADKTLICSGGKNDGLYEYMGKKTKGFIAILHGEHDDSLLKSDGTFVVRGQIVETKNGFLICKDGMLFIIDLDVAGADALLELEANKNRFSDAYCNAYKEILENLGEGWIVPAE